ncbi:hypothetical protein BHYA_0169g00060 [Botrytis hyacinthi]|uniref:Uncharacterized protein n=1 Tax=Botrytis hyacinthi TaxID=278943 RepID=A0A4Z1GDS9_9HELO|nr:hypothetical protein BHYA_0169g00060 [Botrytis hyacinthi]
MEKPKQQKKIRFSKRIHIIISVSFWVGVLYIEYRDTVYSTLMHATLRSYEIILQNVNNKIHFKTKNKSWCAVR